MRFFCFFFVAFYFLLKSAREKEEKKIQSSLWKRQKMLIKVNSHLVAVDHQSRMENTRSLKFTTADCCCYCCCCYCYSWNYSLLRKEVKRNRQKYNTRTQTEKLQQMMVIIKKCILIRNTSEVELLKYQTSEFSHTHPHRNAPSRRRREKISTRKYSIETSNKEFASGKLFMNRQSTRKEAANVNGKSRAWNIGGDDKNRKRRGRRRKKKRKTKTNCSNG